MERVDNERKFHDQLAKRGFIDRSLLRRMACGFYDKEIVWAPVWQNIGDLSGKVVLDFGCGAGDFSLYLAGRGAIVHGIDISEELISMAERSIAGSDYHVEFFVSDAHRTEFPDHFFDFVFGNGILHHLDLETAYNELARILKPTGKAFFMEPLARHPAVRLVRRLTPRARSIDERPLTLHDINLAEGFFKEVLQEEYFLLSVAAAPLYLMSARIGKFAIRVLHGIDRFVFTLAPRSREYAWITLLTLVR